tara:strand:- start:190 stop:720 length:531 start_codon:yes stop_codon:yes gene_type:complete
MDKYIALLRGINVGGKNILPMKELVSIFQSLGASDVSTYIQSGNVVFTSAIAQRKGWCEKLTQKVQELKGFSPQLLLLTKIDLERAIDSNPFPVEDAKSLHFFFLAQEPAKDKLIELAKIEADTEQYHLKERIFYLYTPAGFGRSKLASRVEKILAVPTTARNWNTILKLAQLSGT